MVEQPYPSNVPVKPRTLQPLVLLPRSQLPLSSLDIISSSNVLPQTRLFEAHVKILELEERMGSQPMVLIARLDDGRTLYAIEREDRGLYVLCKLGSWVNLQPLRAVAAVSRQELPKSLEKGFGVGEMPQNVTPAPTTISECTKFSKKKRLAIEAIQSMVKRPSSGFLTDSQSNTSVEPEKTKEPKHTNATQKEPIAQLHDMDDATIQPTAAEIFENVRTQYFDALYLSKASCVLHCLPLALTQHRLHWHTSQKDLYHEHEQLFI
jgi:DNA replication regulator SLD3